MVHQYEVYCINWASEEVGICVEGVCHTVPLEAVILMKNTHKQDISGQDVYEGDFIESHQGSEVLDILMQVKYGTYESYCPVDKEYMDNVGFYVEAVDYPQMPLGPLEDYAKVIGNMYENADWLGYNQGHDCDCCENHYLCGRDGDSYGCRRQDEELKCQFIRIDESN